MADSETTLMGMRMPAWLLGVFILTAVAIVVVLSYILLELMVFKPKRDREARHRHMTQRKSALHHLAVKHDVTVLPGHAVAQGKAHDHGLQLKDPHPHGHADELLYE